MTTETLKRNNVNITNCPGSVSILLSSAHDNNDLTTYPPADNTKSTQSIMAADKKAFNDDDGSKKKHPVARERWKILAKVLHKELLEQKQQQQQPPENQTNDELSEASVRRFKSFDLLRLTDLEEIVVTNILGKQGNWYSYKIHLNNHDYDVNIHHIDRHLTAQDLIGFNNTGNICIWPSEEALTVYVLSRLASFNNKWILELGGGMTCLSGLMLAKYGSPYVCHLTDGNTESVENIRKTICLNDLSCYTKCSVLKWENLNDGIVSEHEKFDIILSADCLFFDDVRESLVNTIWYYLARTGIALVMAPKRGKTMNDFLSICIEKGFQCQIENHYNDEIWQRHLTLKKSNSYNEDIHYPVLLKLTKKDNANCMKI